ncbi:rod shape-determining protein [Candidatus Levyibacteriota bacterium]|nr:rod shape-determining protein [Candidatus Levybacteria bacterium]
MFDRFFSFFSHDIGIDLGTANTLVWVLGKGIVVREPSVIAMHKKTKKIIAIGTEAKKMIGKTPAPLITIRPLKGGVISDFDATRAMIAHYIKGVHEMGNRFSNILAKPKVVIGIPSSVTEVERRAVWEAALKAGAREAYLIEEPMAAAIGEGISVFQPNGIMVVDIGGGTTEIAVISLGGIVVSRSLRLAGDDMNHAIVHYIRLRHCLLIGETTAEELKIKIGSAYKKSPKAKTKIVKYKDEKDEVKEDSNDKMYIVRGRDIESGLPKSLRVTEVEVREAISPVVSQIIEAIADILEESPPELTSDILENGILLTGGGAMLAGLDHLIVERTHMPVNVAVEPLLSVVKGTGRVLEDAKLLHRVKVTGGLY